jgi:hypothetical protein
MTDVASAVVDYHRAGVALLRASAADDWQGVEAILADLDAGALLLALAAQFNSFGQRETGSPEAWDGYLADVLAHLPPG